jgi:hypothetical protein
MKEEKNNFVDFVNFADEKNRFPCPIDFLVVLHTTCRVMLKHNLHLTPEPCPLLPLTLRIHAS